MSNCSTSFLYKTNCIFHRFREQGLVGRYGFLSTLSFIALIHIICFYAPNNLKNLDFSVKEARLIASSLFNGYISVLGVVLAIAAIILALIQISNSRLNITKLIFTRTLFIPLVYFGIINIFAFGILQLLHRPNDEVFYEQWYIQAIIASIYTFIFFVILILLVFFKTFRYLDFSNVLDDYLRDILIKVKIGYSNDYLSVRGSEVNSEVLRMIEMENNVMLEKLLLAFKNVSGVNPTTTFLFGMETKLAEWHILVFKKNKRPMWNTFFSIWRDLRVLAVNSDNQNLKYSYSFVPKIVVSELTEGKADCAFTYALHLKELIVFPTLSTEIKDKPKIFFQRASYFLHDLAELVNMLAERGEYDALKKAYNQFDQVIDSFQDDYQSVHFITREPVENEAFNQERSRFLHKVYRTALGVFSYYVYRIQFVGNEVKYDERVYDLLSSRFNVGSHSLSAADICSTTSSDAIDWRRWIWNLDDREDGRAYIIPNEENILAFGLINLYFKYPHLEPSSITPYIKDFFVWIQNNPGQFLKSLPGITIEVLTERIGSFNTLIVAIEEKNELVQAEAIIEAYISKEKILAFRELIKNQWLKSRNLYNVFDYYKALDLNPADTLYQVGTPRINLKNGKKLFINDDREHPFSGIEWGFRVNKEVERAFLDELKNGSIDSKNAVSVTSALATVVEHLERSLIQTLVAFIPIDKMYRWQVELVNSERYQSFEAGNNPYPFDALGIYDNKIVIVKISKGVPDVNLVVLNLPSAMSYQQRQKQEYMNNQLEISIKLNCSNADLFDNLAEADDSITPPSNAIITIQEIMRFKIINKDEIFTFKVG